MTAAQLQQVIASIYPAAVTASTSTYTMAVDTSGNATIALWNNTLGTEPTTAQLTAALTALQLAAAQQSQIATLDASYNGNRYGAPVAITSGSTTLTFPTDTATQMNVMGLLAAYGLPNSVAVPTGGIPLQDNSGTTQTLTLAQVQQLAGAIANQSISAWQTLDSLQAQVSAATTIAAVQAIVWPAN